VHTDFSLCGAVIRRGFDRTYLKESSMRRFMILSLSSVLLFQLTPLSAAPAAGRNRPGRSGEQASSRIEGQAPIVKGQAAARQLQLRSLDTGQLVGTTTCDSSGAFSFADRRPGSYSVELVSPTGAIVATSSAIALPAGVSAAVTVAPTGPVNGTTPTAARTAVTVTTTAIAAGIPGVVVAGRPLPSPSF
jgi:hypothetical protein